MSDPRTTEKQDKATGPGPKAGGKRSHLPILLIVGIVLALNVVIVAKVFLGGKPGDAKAHKPAAPEMGKKLALEEFLVNLADPGEETYLKASITLGLKKGVDEKKLEEELAPIRDTIIGVLCGCTSEAISSEQGKEKLKQILRTRINKELHGEKVLKVYFTAFATQ